MNIRLIAEGSTKLERFICRWGISFLIGEDILFDAFGDPGVFLNNCEKYKIDLSKIKYIVISHDDWDHIAGLWYVLNKHKEFKVYVCPNSVQDIKERIRSFGVNVLEADKFLNVRDDVYTTGELKGESEGRIIYEQALAVRSSKGLTVITGCAHPGILNIIGTAEKQFGMPVHCLIGGFHLKDMPPKEVKQIIVQLKKSKLEKIVPLHCTGKRSVRLIKEAFGNKCIYLKQGDILEI